MQEYEVIFEDGSEYCVEGKNDLDARCEAEDQWLYDHDPGIPARYEVVEDVDLPKIKSCVAI